MNTKDLTFREPKITTSILGSIPDCLYTMLQEKMPKTTSGRISILVSSNNLANRFILERWGIRSSQRRRYKNLYSTIRKQCRVIFRHYLSRGGIGWMTQDDEFVMGVYKFDEVRGNMILGFVSPIGYLDHIDPS